MELNYCIRVKENNITQQFLELNKYYKNNSILESTIPFVY